MTEAVIVIVLDKDLLMAAQCHLTSDNLSHVAVNSVTNKCINNVFCLLLMKESRLMHQMLSFNLQECLIFWQWCSLNQFVQMYFQFDMKGPFEAISFKNFINPL